MTDEQQLIELQQMPLGKRILGYIRLSGPGYMQSAMTLGGGTIAACVVMGSLVGYELLFVQTCAIIFGVTLLGAVAKQTCHSGEGAYQVFWRRLHPLVAIVWGGSALVATVLWHIPQYSLTANGVVALGEGLGLDLDPRWCRIVIGAAVLAAATGIVYLYSAGARGLRLYELAVKVLVWLIVVAFAIVALTTGIDFRRLFLGLTGITFLQDLFSGDGIDPRLIKPIVGGLAAAVGINMVFLYPYSLLNKNWGKHHKELAYFDLWSGMVIPFLIATSFMIVAVANTVGPPEGEAGAEAIRDVQAIVPVLGPTFAGIVGSETLGRGLALLLVGLGMVAIGFSTIITHMLASGFTCCELFGIDYRSKAKFWFSLVPGVGVVGVFLKFPFWAAITASSLASVFMPVAIVGFIILLNMPSFMKEEMPRGGRRLLWNVVLVTYLVVISIASYFGIVANLQELGKRMNPPVEAAVIEPADVPADETGDAVASAPKPVIVQRDLMHATFQIIMYPPEGAGESLWTERAAESAFDAIDSLERRISVWRDDSQARRVNDMAATTPVNVSQDLFDAIVLSREISTRTEGAFDISVGPLIELWGYYRKQEHLPTRAEVDEALTKTGMDKVRLKAETRAVTFGREGVRLDFGGIAKGLAADCAGAALKKHGIVAALINGGSSSILAMGAPPGEDGWTVKVIVPDSGDRVIDEIVLRDESLSTSGCYGKYMEFDGTKYCHIFDPRTGWPAPGVMSASAVCASAAEADGLSTAFVVLGNQGTEAYCAAHPDVRAIVVPESPDGAIVPSYYNFPSV